MAGNPRDWAPTPGSNWWDEDDKAYERAVRRQQKAAGIRPRRRRRPRWTWVLPPIAVLGFLTAAAVAVGSPDDGEDVALEMDASPGATTTSIPESISDNTTNPPQADLNGDTECTIGTIGSVMARGSLTNHSSTTSSYTIHVSFNDAAGVRFAEAAAAHIDVRSGETVLWDATPYVPPVDGAWTCEVVSIERFASQ